MTAASRTSAASRPTRIAGADAPIARVSASAYTIPTDAPEADGTIDWNATGLVVAEVEAGGVIGLGYSYADPSAGSLVVSVLASAIKGIDAMDTSAAWVAMTKAVRNVGRPGVASCAISALDVALWDLKSKLIGLPLARVLGVARREIAAYGSGGFTSYSNERLAAQLGGWAADGLGAVKMKIGRAGRRDVDRVRVAREAIGPDVELFVDANGAYTANEAIAYAEAFSRFDVSWFEEPVSSDDPPGLRLVRQRAPSGMRIAAGEYGYEPVYFERMLGAQAVDVLQADGTRCGGVSGFLRASTVCELHHAPLSAHTAPSLHATLCCVAPPAMNVEYFYDHARIEQMLFDGARTPVRGRLAPDWERPGLGLELKRADAARYAA